MFLLNPNLVDTTVKIEAGGGDGEQEISWKIESWTGHSIEGQNTHSGNYIFNANGTIIST